MLKLNLMLSSPGSGKLHKILSPSFMNPLLVVITAVLTLDLPICPANI